MKQLYSIPINQFNQPEILKEFKNLVLIQIFYHILPRVGDFVELEHTWQWAYMEKPYTLSVRVKVLSITHYPLEGRVFIESEVSS